MIINKYEEVAPAIFVYDNVIQDCDSIIKLALSENNWRDSEVVKDGKKIVNKKMRSTEVFDISSHYKDNEIWWLTSRTIWNYADSYGKENEEAFEEMEPLQLLRYRTNSGFYNTHYDHSSKTPRVFSAILYLNDVDDGGETFFNRFNVSIKPKSGRLVLFPANFVYTHEAKVPKSNEKFAIVTWFKQIIDINYNFYAPVTQRIE